MAVPFPAQSLEGSRLPPERCDLGCGSSLRPKQTCRELTAGSCPEGHSPQGPSLKGEVGWGQGMLMSST